MTYRDRSELRTLVEDAVANNEPFTLPPTSLLDLLDTLDDAEDEVEAVNAELSNAITQLDTGKGEDA